MSQGEPAPNEPVPNELIAFSHRREILQRLDNLPASPDGTRSEEEAGLMDDLMTLDMSLQPFRRAMSKRAEEGNAS